MLRDAQTRDVRQHQPAFVMAAGGDTVTCAELELRSNRLAHFLRASGLRRLDHYAIFIENNTLMSNAAAPASAWASTTPASARI